jgi:hypothetical protein
MSFFKFENMKFKYPMEFKQIRDAFIDLLDGINDWRDIQKFTGLPDERCKEILEIFKKETK